MLHVDCNDYYGGPEAAFSLQEAEAWVEKSAEKPSHPFSNVSLQKPETSSSKKLSPSRAYTLTLSPQIIYSKSKLLGQLVSSQVYRQLEFQAVGNWWLYDNGQSSGAQEAGTLKRMPNGREDIFSDRSIDVRAKRGLMKFLKFVIDFENQSEVWEPHGEASLPDFLASQFQLPPSMQTVILALTLSVDLPSETSVRYALPRIARHLTSIGVFGPGFGAVIPKWGGAAEIAQVACRAGAVGGAVYVLGTGVADVASIGTSGVELKLTNGEAIRSGYYVYDRDARDRSARGVECTASPISLSKTINIISSDLSELFRTTVEGAPTAAVSVVAFPADSLIVDGESSPYPVYVMAHSSDTGECPQGQCVLYGSTANRANPKSRLAAAISSLLESIPVTSVTIKDDSEQPVVLFELYYEQGQASDSNFASETACAIPSSSLDLAFNDTALDNVEDAWRRIMRNLADDDADTELETPYMDFKAREQFGDDDENDMDGL